MTLPEIQKAKVERSVEMETKSLGKKPTQVAGRSQGCSPLNTAVRSTDEDKVMAPVPLQRQTVFVPRNRGPGYLRLHVGSPRVGKLTASLPDHQ